MITELVLFDLPKHMTREQVAHFFRQNAPKWRANSDLIRKNYLYDATAQRGGGVYLWPDVAAAQRAHDASWCEIIRATFGSDPVVQYFETPVVVDNAHGETVVAADSATEAVPRAGKSAAPLAPPPTSDGL
jgi:hypothetical protein